MNVHFSISALALACALGFAALPAQAQTAPPPTSATPEQTGRIGDILFGDGIDAPPYSTPGPPTGPRPPEPTGSGSDLVGGADHPHGDGGVTPDQSAELGDILGGSDTPAAGTGANGGGSQSAGANSGGMSADEYADHLVILGVGLTRC